MLTRTFKIRLFLLYT